MLGHIDGRGGGNGRIFGFNLKAKQHIWKMLWGGNPDIFQWHGYEGNGREDTAPSSPPLAFDCSQAYATPSLSSSSLPSTYQYRWPGHGAGEIPTPPMPSFGECTSALYTTTPWDTGDSKWDSGAGYRLFTYIGNTGFSEASTAACSLQLAATMPARSSEFPGMRWGDNNGVKLR